MPFPKDDIAPKFHNTKLSTTTEDAAEPNFDAAIKGFVPFANRIILKRDETTPNHPCPDDLVVGELVLNAVTGNLYTKLVSGQVVYYPGMMVCVGKQGIPSNTFDSIILAPDNYYDDTYIISLYGITVSTHKHNELRFNALSNIQQGFPSSFALLYSLDNTNFIEIARVTIIADYADAHFEFVYKDIENIKPLKGQFKVGLYDNKSLGFLKIEAV